MALIMTELLAYRCKAWTMEFLTVWTTKDSAMFLIWAYSSITEVQVTIHWTMLSSCGKSTKYQWMWVLCHCFCRSFMPRRPCTFRLYLAPNAPAPSQMFNGWRASTLSCYRQSFQSYQGSSTIGMYCHCHQPEDSRWLIKCPQCQEWFHSSCDTITPIHWKKPSWLGQEL